MLSLKKFDVGDKALYPAHGVGVIERLEAKEVAGTSVEFYVLRILSSGATLMVPVQGSDKIGLRGLLSEDEISSVFSILKSPGQVTQKAWNRRIRDFTNKMRTGSINDVAEVARDLSALGSKKELSFGEKQMLEKCVCLIVSEVSASGTQGEEVVREEISKILVSSIA